VAEQNKDKTMNTALDENVKHTSRGRRGGAGNCRAWSMT